MSIPTATYRSLEQARKRLRKSRSAVVTEAVEAWLRQRGLDDADVRYVKGYVRRPESPDEVAVTEAIAIDAMSSWERWD